MPPEGNVACMLNKTISILLIVFALISCRNTRDQQAPLIPNIIVPSVNGKQSDGNKKNQEGSETIETLSQLDIGDEYNILAIYDSNINFEQSDEQLLVAVPLDDENAPLQLMIASMNPRNAKYDIVWTHSLSTRTLTGITLQFDDINKDDRQDILISGFDANGHHLTEIFATGKNTGAMDFQSVFKLVVNGNIDIVSPIESQGAFPVSGENDAHWISVQEHDEASDNELDLIESDWFWSESEFAFVQGEVRFIEARTIQEGRIAEVYAGAVSDYENFLDGGWYRENGERAFKDFIFFDPLMRRMNFYDGSIMEPFVWETSHHTTAKRLYTRITNTVIPSISDKLRISAESWEQITVSRSNSGEWDGTYQRFAAPLQTLMESEHSLGSLLATLSIEGIWQGSDNQRITFTLPSIEWIKGNKQRIGTASIFALEENMILQIQFLKDNGAVEASENWKIDYEEIQDKSRIIRSLSLSPAHLSAEGIITDESDILSFEQIEVLRVQ